MSNINSNYSSVGAKASANKGISGMMSGMDTEAMVEKMLSGTQKKIDKQESLKQQNTWKQEIYRDMISSINTFYGKYFDNRFGSTLKSNFASNNFFNTMLSKVTAGAALRVTGTNSNAATGDIKIAVKQLAEQAKLTSDTAVSGDQTLTGSALDPDSLSKQFNKQITFIIGTDTVDVDLNNVKTQDEMVSTIQAKLDEKGITDVTAKIHDGKLRLVSTDPDKKISINPLTTSSLGLQMTGLGTYSKTPIKGINGSPTGSMIEASGQINMDAGISFDLTLDGVTKTITVKDVERTDTDGKYTTNADNLKEAVATQVKRAFGDSIKVDTKNGALKFNIDIKDSAGVPEIGHELTVGGLSSDTFGFNAGSSTLINTGTKLSDLGLNGDSFAFKINGQEFSFNGSDSLGTVMNAINTSDAGVKISYSSISDTFKMESTIPGKKYGIEVSQTKGDLLTKLFGDKIASSDSVSTTKATTDSIDVEGINTAYSSKTGSMKIIVNGTEHTFSLAANKDGSSLNKAEIESQFNSWLKKTFKTQSDDTTANISYENGKLSIAKGFTVEFKQTTVDLDNAKAVEEAKKTDLALAMGFNKQATSNIIKSDSLVSEAREFQGIDFKDASGGAATKLSDIKSVNINGDTYDAEFVDGKISIKGSGNISFSSSTSDQNLKALLGNKDTISLGDGAAKANAVKEGKDAIIMVNGVETSRNSNSITIDGISMELTSVSKEKLDSAGNPISGAYEETVISTSRDNDTIIEEFKSFVTDYNAMIDKLKGYISEDSDYRKYDPLTADQKKEMSESEIKLWDEKAKKGLVRSDDTVTNFLSEMRGILYSKPDSSSVALYQIGIETTTDYNDGGKIKLDENALRTALAADPDAVRNLFTDKTDGLAKKLTTAMDGIAKQSVSSPGSLVALAGVKGSTTEKNNTLYERITGMESRIKDLKIKFEKEKSRYWTQFNSMERILAGFNAQSSMISQQFGS